MSYTNQTAHYGIPLPTETDLVNGLDWNTSSEAIDSAIYDASEAAGTASRDITAIKATIADLQDADVQFQQDLNEATGRIATLEQNAGKDEQDIQDLADMITDKEVTQAQSDAHVRIGEWFRYNGVLYVCTVEIQIGDTIIPNTNCRATNIEDEMPSAGESVIDDTTTSADKTWSSQKISTPVAGDTRYNIQTGKMQYYDGAQWQDAPQGGGAMPNLDFANPVSITNNMTTDKDYYMCGTFVPTASSTLDGTLSINSTVIIQDVYWANNTPTRNYVSPLFIPSGSTISFTNASVSGSALVALHLFEAI